VCPTKSVAIHGPRFAYALVPQEFYEELRYCYANTAGSGSAYDRAAAFGIMEYLNSRLSNSRLVALIQARHELLRVAAFIDDPIGAEASYFCFVRTPVDPQHLIVMDQRFFDVDCFPGLIRMNLLLPKQTLVPFIRLAAIVRDTDEEWLQSNLVRVGIVPLGS